MKKIKAWFVGVWAAAKVDEKKLRRYLTALGAIVVTAAYQVFDVGIAAVVAMTPRELVKRFVVCLAFGVLGALVHGGPFKAFALTPSLEVRPAEKAEKDET